MNAGGRVNPTRISTLLGQARGTLALDRYSVGRQPIPRLRLPEQMRRLTPPTGHATEVQRIPAADMSNRVGRHWLSIML